MAFGIVGNHLLEMVNGLKGRLRVLSFVRLAPIKGVYSHRLPTVDSKRAGSVLDFTSPRVIVELTDRQVCRFFEIGRIADPLPAQDTRCIMRFHTEHRHGKT